jgi:hypothetical protein
MTPSTQTFRSLTVITALALALSGTAFAGGTHAGGHGHGGDDLAWPARPAELSPSR